MIGHAHTIQHRAGRPRVAIVYAPTISFSGAVSQAEGVMTITLNLNRNGVVGVVPFTWGFDAVNGVVGTVLPDDFISGVIPVGVAGTFLAGQSTATITLDVNDDLIPESDETISIVARLNDFPTSTAGVLLTVLNNDYVTLGALSLSDNSFVVGSSKTVNLQGASDGSTVIITSGVTGFSINNAARTITYDGSGSSGAKSLGLSEALAGATNTPNPTTIGFTVSASVVYVAPYLLDVTAPAANALLSAQAGWSTATGSTGVTTGFKFSGAPQRLVTPNLGTTAMMYDAGSGDQYMRYFAADNANANVVLMRFTDWNNYIEVTMSNVLGASSTMGINKIRTRVAGTFVTVTNNINFPLFADVDQIELRVVGNFLTVYVGGSLIRLPASAGTFDVSAVPAGTKIAIPASGVEHFGNMEIGPVAVSTRRLMINEVSRVTQRERSGANAGKASFVFSGSYNGPAPTHFRIFNGATGADITGFSAQAGTFTLNSGNWALAALALPAGVVEYRIEVWSNDLPLQRARSVPFFVGEVIVLLGQSGADEMAIMPTSGTVGAYTHHPAAWWFMESTTGPFWSRFDNGTGGKGMMGKFMSDLVTSFGCAVGQVSVASGGQALDYFQKGNTSSGSARLYDKPGETVNHNLMSLTEKSARVGKFGSLFWVHQGASNADSATVASYLNGSPSGTGGINKLFSDIRADFGIGAGGADMWIFMDMLDIGATDPTTSTDTPNSPSNWASIRKAYNDYAAAQAAAGAKVRLVATGMDYTHIQQSGNADNLHRGPADYMLTMQRATPGIAIALGGSGYTHDGLGPIVTGIARSGSTIVVSLNANGCTGLLAGTATTFPANWMFTDAAGANINSSITGYTVDSATMKVTVNFAAAVPANTKMSGFQAANTSRAGLIMGTYADGTPNCSIRHLTDVLTAA